MSEREHRTSRIISSVAATVIALACGTNYAYSAWAPQFADKLQLSATQSNLIGLGGNIGMYATGIPMGMLVDRAGPRPAAIIGAVCLAAGYFPIRNAYESGPGSMGVGALSFLSFLTGTGSCSAFQAALKASALNWPHHRGTATAFPLAAFGLSAFFFTTISSFAFPNDAGKFLLLLSLGTFCMVAGGLFFLRVVDHQQGARYTSIPEEEGVPRRGSIPHQLHRTRSSGSKHSLPKAVEEREDDTHEVDADETSSLVAPSREDVPEDDSRSRNRVYSHRADIRGFAMFKKLEFWQLWMLMGLLTGIGLMTINNIGNDVQALWKHYDDSASKAFISKQQLMHVSILSFMSFLGRLASGVGSDVLVKRFKLSRFWCVTASASTFCIAQLCGMKIENPNALFLVSGLNGLAYGMLFGVFPVVVVDTFGVNGLSVNWGFMTLAPVLSGNIFNICYGSIYDHHTTTTPEGERGCMEGLQCYASAYWITFLAGIVGVVVSLWGVKHEHAMKNREPEDDSHIA